MIHLNEEELKKVELLDILFKYISANQLREMVDSQAIVDKLTANGNESVNPVLKSLYKENKDLHVRIMSMESKLYALEMDFVTLAKIVGKRLNLLSDMDYQNLCGRRGIY